jgi:hypothetical protein
MKPLPTDFVIAKMDLRLIPQQLEETVFAVRLMFYHPISANPAQHQKQMDLIRMVDASVITTLFGILKLVLAFAIQLFQGLFCPMEHASNAYPVLIITSMAQSSMEDVIAEMDSHSRIMILE